MSTQTLASVDAIHVKPLTRETPITALEYARTLSKPRNIGEPASSYLPFFGCMTKEDGELMLAAIEEGCGQVWYDSTDVFA